MVRDPRELGKSRPEATVAAPETTTYEAYTTSSIVSRADGSFMSLTPEEMVSAVVEIPRLSGAGRDATDSR